ncbi:hypothetical protein AB6N23_07895 [Cellulomonas sp. 179-A 9B4 NHS]|uniref:hypothetical protein n=1 Tax=Cellulomonas sp. 179-A 9B4 NHS TaxID=3142379 RepID=UPI0039A014A0
MTSGEVQVRELRSRTWYRWIAATLVAVVVVAGWVAATQPENRVWVAVGLPLLGLWFTYLGWRSASFDPTTGVVATIRCRVRREIQLVPGTEVALVPNGAGGLLLALRPPDGRRRTYLLVLALSDYVEASQPPELLTALADTLVRFCGEPAEDVAKRLREQAAHVARGGTAATSPLAPMVTRGALGAAKAGGAGAVGGHLD